MTSLVSVIVRKCFGNSIWVLEAAFACNGWSYCLVSCGSMVIGSFACGLLDWEEKSDLGLCGL